MCGEVPGSGGTLYGTVTCPAEGMDTKTYTDKECTTRCELPACKKLEKDYTGKFGECLEVDGSYVIVTGASMLATAVSATLLAAATVTF